MSIFTFSFQRISILTLLACLLSLQPVMAQDDTPSADSTASDDGRKKISGAYGYFSMGYQAYSMESFNEYFAEKAFAPLHNNDFSLGGGGTLIVRDIVLGGEGQSILTRRASSSLKNVQLNSGWGVFYLGYVVAKSKHMVLYPKAIIGGFNNEMVIKDQIAGTTLDTISAGDYSGTELVQKGVITGLEVTADFMPMGGETASSGIMMGVSVGYQHCFAIRDWDAYGTPVSGGPKVDLSGIYVRLRLGLGGWNLQR